MLGEGLKPRRSPRLFSVPVLLVVLAATVAGCGSGSTASEAPEAKLQKREADFRRRADAVCVRVDQVLAETANTGAMMAQADIGLGELEAIHPPANLAKTYVAFTHHIYRRQSVRGGIIADASEARYRRSVRLFHVYEREARAEARQMGLRHCPFR